MGWKSLLFVVGLLGLLLNISSCSAWLHQSPQTQHESICKEIRYRMSISSLSTNGQRILDQNANREQLEKSYHDQGCDS